MSNKELAVFVLKLQKQGYKPNPEVWNFSISLVDYKCGSDFSVMFTDPIFRDVPKFYDLHPNQE